MRFSAGGSNSSVAIFSSETSVFVGVFSPIFSGRDDSVIVISSTLSVDSGKRSDSDVVSVGSDGVSCVGGGIGVSSTVDMVTLDAGTLTFVGVSGDVVGVVSAVVVRAAVVRALMAAIFFCFLFFIP